MSDEIAGKIAGTIPQTHGGALLPGGVKGHKGGPGRPPAEIRARCADSFYDNMGKAERILRSKKASNMEKLKALDLLGKYGGLMHTTSESTVTKRPHREAVEEVRRRLGLDAA
jgi:hypothetical protein